MGLLANLGVFLFLGFSFNGNYSPLDISISNLVNADQSVVYIAFYQSEDDFPNSPINQSEIRIERSEEISYQFERLQEGRYFVAVFQDLDFNQELNKNLIGIPKEPYGFSNNIKPGITGLNLSKGFFEFPDKQKIEIDLVY